MSVYKNYEEHIRGIYKDSIIPFIQRSKALGLKFYAQTQFLALFDKFTEQYANLPPEHLAQNVVAGWVTDPTVTVGCRRRRAILMRQLGEYMISCGKTAYLYPEKQFKTPAKYDPFIFSQKQIKTLLCCADTSITRKPVVRSRIACPLIIRMLYCCGLRISETLHLRVCDVNLEDGVLRICDSKFHKDRFVPMTESLTKLCANYAEQYLRFAERSSFFFTPDGKRPYSIPCVYHAFRDYLFDAEIPHRGKGKGPRLHDFRHSFAVHSLKQLAEAGTDLYVSLPVLSVYLGHNSVSATQWYLQLTAEVYPHILSAVDSQFGDVYPEVPYEQEAI